MGTIPLYDVHNAKPNRDNHFCTIHCQDAKNYVRHTRAPKVSVLYHVWLTCYKDVEEMVPIMLLRKQTATVDQA